MVFTPQHGEATTSAEPFSLAGPLPSAEPFSPSDDPGNAPKLIPRRPVPRPGSSAPAHCRSEPSSPAMRGRQGLRSTSSNRPFPAPYERPRRSSSLGVGLVSDAPRGRSGPRSASVNRRFPIRVNVDARRLQRSLPPTPPTPPTKSPRLRTHEAETAAGPSTVPESDVLHEEGFLTVDWDHVDWHAEEKRQLEGEAPIDEKKVRDSKELARKKSKEMKRKQRLAKGKGKGKEIVKGLLTPFRKAGSSSTEHTKPAEAGSSTDVQRHHDPAHKQLKLGQPAEEFEVIDLEDQTVRRPREVWSLWEVSKAIVMILNVITFILSVTTLWILTSPE